MSFWASSSFLLLTASSAHAIERQHHVGLDPALAVLKVDGKTTASTGVGGALHYAYGLTDQWNLGGEIGSAIVAADQKQDLPASPLNRPATVDHLTVGVGYVIDILRWVPHLGLQGGVYRLAGGTMADALLLPGVNVNLALDYQVTRHFAVGVGIRQHLFFTKVSTYPSYTTAMLRFEVMWGY